MTNLDLKGLNLIVFDFSFKESVKFDFGAIQKKLHSQNSNLGPASLPCHSSFMDKNWGADLIDMQLISKYKKIVRIPFFIIISTWSFFFQISLHYVIY